MNNRARMKWLKRFVLLLAVLLAVAVALPFFITLDDYIPQIEKEVSASIQQPVTIKSIRFGALPLPHITVEGIKVGTDNNIQLGKIKLTPDLFSLLQPPRVITRIDIDSMTLTRNALMQIQAWRKSGSTSPPQQPPQFRIENILLHNARIDLDKTAFGPFEASVSLDGKGVPRNVSIATQDGKLKLHIKVAKSKYLIDASAKSWRLPLGPALMFDDLSIKGTATANDARFDEIRAGLYGGSVTGKTTLAWQQGLQLRGKFDISHLELQPVTALLSPGTRISGKLDAAPVFSAAAASADRLTEALRLETPFDIQNGILNGVDIEKAATSMSKQGSSGGETRFQQLSGHLLREHGGYAFTQLRITSGSIAVVDGNVNISPKQALSGRIQTRLAAVGDIPLNVGGTVDKPMLYPTGGTMTGAAIGTVILGPGLGTSLGAKVGGWAEGLFGKQKKGAPPKK
ncbi:MAG: AsmA family protein [Sideroxydans sp.]|nr:AsmA family protein [Sideroxydans sp.]